MDTKTAEETLENYLMYGVAGKIFFADEAKAMCVEIGNHVERIDAEGFGHLFGSLQAVYSDRQTLAVAKMFDPEDRKYPTRSIPAILNMVERHAPLWSLQDKPKLQELLIIAGQNEATVLAMNNTELSLAIVAYYRSTLPQDNSASTDALSIALKKVREARNKSIAHNEAVAQSARSLPTWGEAEALVNYAKAFVTTMSSGFLNVLLGHSGSYYATGDARGTSIALRRLMEAASLAK